MGNIEKNVDTKTIKKDEIWDKGTPTYIPVQPSNETRKEDLDKAEADKLLEHLTNDESRESEQDNNDERVTIDELTDEKKQELEDRNNDKKDEILSHIGRLVKKELSSKQKDTEILSLESYFSENAKINYWPWKIITSNIKGFFKQIREWKVPIENLKITNMVMNKKIYKLKIPWGYILEQKIDSITFSN